MVLFLITYLIITFFLLFNNSERAFILRRVYVIIAAWIMGISITKEGQPSDQVGLYVCNHRSFSDPVVVTRWLNAFVIAKAEVANMPIISQGAKLTGIIYVKRENSDSRKATRQAMIESIKSGQNVLIYPEGTTNDQLTVKEYRPGSFHEAVKHGIPVIPVVCEYKEEKALWSNRNLRSQFFRQLGMWKIHAKVHYGPAMTANDGTILRDQVQDWTNKTIKEMHRNWDSVFKVD